MDSPRLPVGERIVYYRRENGNRTRAAVAGLCGISERYLAYIEGGQRIPSHDVLVRIAAELGVPVSALLTEDSAPEPAAPPTIAPAVARALMGYGAPRSRDALPVGELRDRVEAAWRIWQTSRTRFTEIATVLPPLIADVEHAARAHRHGTDDLGRRDVLRTAADLYGLTRSYCRRTGRNDLALVVADRALRAAEDADDPIRIAAASWNMGHVMLSDPREGAVEEAADIALSAIETLTQGNETRETSAMAGALQLVAVVACARRRQWWKARDRLADQACGLGDRAGEGNVQHTVFGPTNVALHALSIEMLAGETGEALRVADSIDTHRLPSRERAFTFTLEVARCYAMRHEDAATLVHLLRLEELSAEDLARSPAALDLLADLRRRARPTYRDQVDALAVRAGLT
ncbi:helix-turn-helix domain-containing protein [Streptomyces sp. TLI_146]|uniref:helix-turn-helix domain-containing protein n=1 Tax=Streptomyces sp. TLI_146 TaxID=1938858 RepID=UPI000C708A11|nr:helix-turn-helix transcriptional regulator [Streptomyces sp. TLI_146]PKV77022.1 helix-turn-helix protein [Streptomyces sp. TLI_146]